MYVCMYVQNERVCHTISGLKCCIRRTRPPHLLEAQKTCGGVYFMWSGEIFLRNFLPYPPSKYSRVKGGDVYINMFYPLKRHKLNKRETYPLSHRILLDYTGSLRGTPTMGQNPQKAR